jgi:hypothetical protein
VTLLPLLLLLLLLLLQVLNAKPENVERESEIVAQSGRKGAVTISTNMAGEICLRSLAYGRGLYGHISVPWGQKQGGRG